MKRRKLKRSLLFVLVVACSVNSQIYRNGTNSSAANSAKPVRTFHDSSYFKAPLSDSTVSNKQNSAASDSSKAVATLSDSLLAKASAKDTTTSSKQNLHSSDSTKVVATFHDSLYVKNIVKDTSMLKRQSMQLKNARSLNSWEIRQYLGFATAIAGAVGAILTVYNSAESITYNVAGQGPVTVKNSWTTVHSIAICLSISAIAAGIGLCLK